MKQENRPARSGRATRIPSALLALAGVWAIGAKALALVDERPFDWLGAALIVVAIYGIYLFAHHALTGRPPLGSRAR